MEESLLEKLKSLGVQHGARNISAPASSKKYPIEEVLTGYEYETVNGKTFIVENTYPKDFQHGIVSFDDSIDWAMLLDWGKVPELQNSDLSNFLFLDTETSGLAGGAGTFAFMVGLGYFDQNGFRLLQLFLREPIEEVALISALDQIVSPFTAVVTFNGKSFDIPLLNNRFILNRVRSPFQKMAHIDLLSLARKLWRNRLPSRTLGNLEIEILRLGRSSEEIPGWMVPELYVEYLQKGDARPLAGVFYHNQMDILSLAALFRYCAKLLSNPLEVAKTEGLDLAAIANLFETLNRQDQAIPVYEQSLNHDLPTPFHIQTLNRFAGIFKKNRQYQEAVGYWEKAAELGDIEACVELAKYYEHQEKRADLAIIWVNKAIEMIGSLGVNDYAKFKWNKDLTYRFDRLQKILNKMDNTY